MAIKQSDAPPASSSVPSACCGLPKTYSHDEANRMRFRNARMHLAGEKAVYLTS